MSTIITSTDVEAPLRDVYNQWTQFEDFPKFMDGVLDVTQHSNARLHWKVVIAGVEREWDAQITEQVPDELIAWTSQSGARNDGLVAFEALDAGRTRVELRLDIEPNGIIEKIGDMLGSIENRAKGDMYRFKQFIEHRAQPTGEWRGTVEGGRVNGDATHAGEVYASTGGVVDLDRVLGRIPVALVFVEPLFDTGTNMVLTSIGDHLAEFGRGLIQVLCVAAVDQATAVEAERSTVGNARILADTDGSLAHHFGVGYRNGRPTTVLIAADGTPVGHWVDTPDAGFATELLERIHEYAS